tara:strand:+ start:301 stop:1749 length:1449 start_codon:yes stop_codon:yes gene_type:complete
MIPLNHLQQLSKQKKKQKKYDGTITGLVWRISATGQVSAAYRIAPQHGRKEVNKVFFANMPLESKTYKSVRKQAMGYMLKVANGEPVFENNKRVNLNEGYSIGEYNLLYRQDRPIEQRVKDRTSTKKLNSVKRDLTTERWIMSRVVGSHPNGAPMYFSDVKMDDPQIPSMLDRILNEVARTGKGKIQYQRSLAHLKRVFKNARRNKIIDSDPLEDIESISVKSHRAKDIPPAELLLILRECRRYASSEGPYSQTKWSRLGLLFEIKALLGCRLNELNTLKKDQINFVTNTITLNEMDTKTGKPYRFAFPEEVSQIFKQSPAWDEHHNQLVFGINNYANTRCDLEWHTLLDNVGLWGKVKPLIYQQKKILGHKNKRRKVSELFGHELNQYKDLAKQIAEIKESRPRGHDTRHAFATSEMRSAIENGAVISENDMNQIAANTGKGLQHSSVEMTMHYTHVDDDMKRGMVSNRLNTLKQLSGSAK